MGDIYIPNVIYWEGVYVLLAWGFFLWALSRTSDWGRLQQRFPADFEVADEPVWRGWQSAVINGVPYPGVVWLGLTEQGLYLKTGPDIFFRLAHPPIFLPWEALSATGSRKAWGREMLMLRVDAVSAKLQLPAKSLEAFRERLPHTDPQCAPAA